MSPETEKYDDSFALTDLLELTDAVAKIEAIVAAEVDGAVDNGNVNVKGFEEKSDVLLDAEGNVLPFAEV